VPLTICSHFITLEIGKLDLNIYVIPTAEKLPEKIKEDDPKGKHTGGVCRVFGQGGLWKTENISPLHRSTPSCELSL